MAKSNPIRIRPEMKGALRAKLGAAPGKPIAATKLAAAKNSPNPTTRKQANFAINERKWAKK